MSRETRVVLVVDDEHEDLMSIGSSLRTSGYRVLEAGNYDTALGLSETFPEKINLLVTDISLPGNNGCELARALLRVNPDLKILFVSGYAGAEVCRFYGFSVSDLHFLRKPFKSAELVARVSQVLDSQERFDLNMVASRGREAAD